MNSFLLFFTATLCLVSCYSPFNKQRIGQYRSASNSRNSWPISSAFTATPNDVNRTLQGGIGANVFDTMFQWNIMEFAFPTQQARAQAIATGQYIPENAAPLGIAASANRIFVSTPRWNLGIPASLSVINLPAFTQSPALEPYPNWDAHTSTTNPDCSRLLSVYRHTIDECGRLFLIDAGIVNALTNLQQLCPPKIVAYDLSTDQQVLNYQLPADQYLQGSLITNIVVDIRNGECNRGFAYVMDVWRNAIIVLDIAQGVSWRTSNHFYLPDPFFSDYNYQGINFQWTDGVFGASLSPLNKPAGDRVLYFHPMSSSNEFSVRTSILRNQTAWTTRTAPANAFTPIGNRGCRGQSATSTMSTNGVMFAAQIQLDGISCWDSRKPYNINNVAMVQRGLGFINDLKIDSGRENIWAVSNNLPTFIYSRLDYTQTNFRLLRANIQRSISKTICDPQVPANNNADIVNSCNNI